MVKPIDQKINRIVCDLGRSRVRLALNPHETLSGDKVIEWSTDEFTQERRCVFEVLNRFLRLNNIDGATSAVAMSVPTHVIDDWVQFFGMAKGWEFSIRELRDQLGLKSLTVINDMVALGYSTPLLQLTGGYQILGDGKRRRSAPILMIGVRSGVGAVCLVQSPLGGSEGSWLPIQSEGGHIELAGSSIEELEILKSLSGNLNRNPTVSDVLSKQGTMRLYELVGDDTQPFEKGLTPLQLSHRANSEKVDAARAAKTIEHWCNFLGSYVRNLALAFGAHGGIYIAGPVPKDLLGGHQSTNQNLFLSRFNAGGPGGDYLSRIPIALVTHENPYLLGLGRIKPPVS